MSENKVLENVVRPTYMDDEWERQYSRGLKIAYALVVLSALTAIAGMVAIAWYWL